MSARLAAAAALLWTVLLAVVGAVPVAGAQTTTWLCRPGQPNDPCGGRSGAPIDCFYVYPTASLQPTLNADRTPSPELQTVARAQAEPFGSACDVWAPVYRQMTLRGLNNASPAERAAALDVAYDDLELAWDDYLAHHNHGRGVVLIGHSQGTRMLRTLIHNRIDGKPVQSQLVSALLIGGNVMVAAGSGVGGDFASVPACTDRTQTGCVVAYSAFSRTPPPDTRYGLSPQTPGVSGTRADLPYGPGYEVLCTNPASLHDNSNAPLHSMVGGRDVDVFHARCTGGAGAHVLMVDGPGAALLPALPNDTWGLHLMDVNLAQRDLVDLVAAQALAHP